jgi:hypothetical protein
VLARSDIVRRSCVARHSVATSYDTVSTQTHSELLTCAPKMATHASLKSFIVVMGREREDKDDEGETVTCHSVLAQHSRTLRGR